MVRPMRSASPRTHYPGAPDWGPGRDRASHRDAFARLRRLKGRSGEFLIEERTVVASTHGRFLVRKPEGGGRAPLLVGFHGYAETAETQLERLRQLPGTERWVLASVQGLHTFYRGRSQDVVASWMTRQHRDLAIADNIAYVSGVVDSVARECETTQGPVLAGFSQGVATAFRAAVWSARPTSRPAPR